jgi:hypothetical protein
MQRGIHRPCGAGMRQTHGAFEQVGDPAAWPAGPVWIGF